MHRRRFAPQSLLTGQPSVSHARRRLFLEALERRDLLAAVTTDKLDYAPAETALVSAMGYAAGEEVRFQVVHIDGTPNTGNGHDPWVVQDGGPSDLDGARDGNVQTSWFVDPDDSLGATFEVSALGLSSGIYDTHIFTDGALPSGTVSTNVRSAALADVSSATFSHTVLAGDNRILLVSVSLEGNEEVSAVSFNGKALARKFRQTSGSSDNDSAVEIWYAVKPDIGTFDVSVTFASGTSPFGITAANFTGVDQFVPFGASAGGSAGSGDPTVNLTTFSNDSVIFSALAKDNETATFTPGANVIERWDIATGADSQDIRSWGGTQTAAIAGPFTMSASSSDYSGGWAMAALELRPPSLPNPAFPDQACNLDIVLVIDVSTSIDDTEYADIVDAMMSFVDAFDGNAQTEFALVAFDSDGIVVRNFTADGTLIIDSLTPRPISGDGSTNWDIGLFLGRSLFVGQNAQPGRAAIPDLLVFASDGNPNRLGGHTGVPGHPADVTDPDDDAQAVAAGIDEANLAKSAGIRIIAVGVGQDVNQDNLIAVSGPNVAPPFNKDTDVVSATFPGLDQALIELADGLCPIPKGTISWEKRTDTNPFPLLGGATFTISPDPTGASSVLTVVDNGPVDANPALGQFQVTVVPKGTFTVTETVAPPGYDIDNDPTRTVVIAAGAQNAVIGVQGVDDPGDTDESDFHNALRPGSVTIFKDTQPNTADDFTFSGSFGAFLLDDDADGTLPSNLNFGNLAPGNYTVTEAALAGFNLTNLVINDPDGGSSVNLATRTATIDVDAGESITVTFTNALPSSVLVVKDAQPNAAQDFSFSGSLGLFLLDDDGDGTLPSNVNFGNLFPGTYTLTEAAVAGWNLSNLVIIDPDGGSSVNLATRTATIDVDAGEAITVTFTNAQEGHISVIKDAQPNSPQDFSFSGNLGAFLLDDDADGTLPSALNFANLVPGTFTITEAQLAGWNLTNLVINDPDGGSSFNLLTRTATIDLDAGEEITVTFTNTQEGRISVIKDTQPDASQDFSFSGSFATFSLDDDADGVLPSSVDFANLLPGTYTVTEAAVAGWNLSNLEINDPDGGSSINLATRTATIDLDAGEQITVTFINTLATGTINVFKDVVPNALQDFTFVSTFGANFQLDDDAGVAGADNALPNNRSFANVLSGVYTLTELAQSGYKLTNLIINDPDGGSSINLAARTATIDLDPGETITVAFTNAPDTIVVTPDKGNKSLPYVHIIDAATGEIQTRFQAYAANYLGGVRVATGDLNGDGVDEIITAPGRNHSPLVKVFDQQGNFLYAFNAFAGSFKGGVDVAVGDVNGDGQNDIITSMTYNGNQVKVFRNVGGPNNLAFTSFSSFNPFGAAFKGGAVVKAASLGTAVTQNGVKKLNYYVDGRAEIIVGSGTGLRSTVKVFSYFGASNAATVVRTFLPLSAGFKGGITLDVARVNADPIPDIIVAAGNGGGSQIQVLSGANGSVLSGFAAFSPADGSHNAPVHVAAQDTNADGIADLVLVAQGTDGATRKIRKFVPLTAQLVDEVLEHSDDFFGAYFLATLETKPFQGEA